MKKKLLNVACATLFTSLSIIAVADSDSEGDEGKVIIDENAEKAFIARTSQAQITSGELTFDDIRLRGLHVFTTPFTEADGYGDGPVGATPAERSIPGGRPTLQGNGNFLRINGLDSHTCLECHTIRSRRTIPMQFVVGGAGGVNNSVLAAASFVNTNDDPDQLNFPDENTGKQNIDGRVINPPFIFGVGGVELLANEMTTDLQALANGLAPGSSVELVTKGVSFGTLVRNNDGTLDTSGVEGIESDPDAATFLVIQPLGLRGEFISLRTIDVAAMPFHLGMQPTEAVGENVDADGDGVVNELTVGDMSTLSIFQASMERPFQDEVKGPARKGRRLFSSVGCAECHIPTLETNSKLLAMRFPEIPSDPSANVFYNIDLSKSPTNFRTNDQGGISVDLFADLKRHRMGPDLAEADGNQEFTTARLWGIADTSPYLHDGRANTLQEAIRMHGQEGSEAKPVVDQFIALAAEDQAAIISFLATLRTPERTGRGLDDDELIRRLTQR